MHMWVKFIKVFDRQSPSLSLLAACQDPLFSPCSCLCCLWPTPLLLFSHPPWSFVFFTLSSLTYPFSFVRMEKRLDRRNRVSLLIHSRNAKKLKQCEWRGEGNSQTSLSVNPRASMCHFLLQNNNGLYQKQWHVDIEQWVGRARKEDKAREKGVKGNGRVNSYKAGLGKSYF